MNPYRGEVAIVIDGRSRTMRLTLGALAGLEARLQAGSLIGLAERFEDGKVATADLIALLAAGLSRSPRPCGRPSTRQCSAARS